MTQRLALGRRRTFAMNLGPRSELALSGALMTAPVWVNWIYYADIVFSAIAAFCGAVLGVYALWHKFSRR
jgi:hypothetical protein